MYHQKTDAKLTQQSPIVSVPVTMYTVEDTKADGIDVEIIMDGLKISEERGDVTVNESSSEKLRGRMDCTQEPIWSGHWEERQV
jgi:hypothetical protein